MTYRFGLFEFAADSGELRKAGRLVPLEPQPARALTLLLAQADELVTREALKAAVWDAGTHVDFDRGLAYCISQIRTALGDSGDSPRFIQTVPRKGYRFIAPVVPPAAVAPPMTADATPVPLAAPAPPAPSRTRRYAAVALTCLAIAALIAGLALRAAPTEPARAIVAVSIFDNETGNPEYDRLVSNLSDLVVAHLTELAPDRVAVVGNAAVLRQPRNIRNLQAVAAGVRADYVILGQLQPADAGLRFITHFIRLSDETHLKANRLSYPDGDLSRLEPDVASEFERAVNQHVLGR